MDTNNESAFKFDDLKILGLHDQSLEELQIFFEKKRIDISVSIFNDISSKYELLSLSFHEVEQVVISDISFFSLSSPEIYSCEFKQEGEVYKAAFTFLIGPGNPSFTFSFCFKYCFK